MKTTALISAALVAASSLVAAAPGGGGGYYGGGGNGNYGGGNGNYGGGNGDWNNYKDGAVFKFTSTYNVIATPDQVVSGTGASSQRAPGQPGAVGYYNFGINSQLDVICYNITLTGVTGSYQSPAKTATHLHQAPRGQGGPPRLAFPNPVGDDRVRRSVGCLTGPFTTGILANGVDTGAGFRVAQIEQNPSAFFCDVHTNLYVPGAVRGQLA